LYIFWKNVGLTENRVGKKTKSPKMSKRERIQEIDQPLPHSLINREIDKAAACFADKYPG